MIPPTTHHIYGAWSAWSAGDVNTRLPHYDPLCHFLDLLTLHPQRGTCWNLVSAQGSLHLREEGTEVLPIHSRLAQLHHLNRVPLGVQTLLAQREKRVSRWQ